MLSEVPAGVDWRRDLAEALQEVELLGPDAAADVAHVHYQATLDLDYFRPDVDADLHEFKEFDARARRLIDTERDTVIAFRRVLGIRRFDEHRYPSREAVGDSAD